MPLKKPKTFNSSELANMSGLSLRQVDHWCTKGYLIPVNGNAKGTPREFSKGEVDLARSMKVLTNFGLDPETAVELTKKAKRQPGGHYYLNAPPILLEWRV